MNLEAINQLLLDQPLIALFAIIASGLLFGSFTIKGINLGSSGVLFTDEPRRRRPHGRHRHALRRDGPLHRAGLHGRPPSGPAEAPQAVGPVWTTVVT